jgi:type VI secretion system protein VasD
VTDKRGFLLCVVCAVLALGGCRSARPPSAPKPLAVQIEVTAAPDLNPDSRGRPSPVLLHVYQLRDGGKFQTSDFESVTARAESVLAADTVGREVLMVQPGASTQLHLNVAPEAQTLGVVAEFSDLTSGRWRAASPVTDGGLVALLGKQTLGIQLSASAVALTIHPINKKGR